MENKIKYCPMKMTFAIYTGNIEDKNNLWNCEKENCAWYNKDTCVIYYLKSFKEKAYRDETL